MNLFQPAKKVSKVYFRFGEHTFVLLAIFIFSAAKQNWTNEEIKKVVQEAKKADYKYLVKVLRSHSTAYDYIDCYH
ncbi:hypothetical protein OD757_06980 [Acinetobacter sp. AYS6]|uniref:hypothetical protein n=1 Tax=Acinetobacter sp. AYS6 TaxID=2983297 RepID=UPI0021D684FD|nr:hypothetical protein [Acinetobacter sp. AYS6]MCU7696963.1 hypothetical protein [Acinetobacter sp. AYS6]